MTVQILNTVVSQICYKSFCKSMLFDYINYYWSLKEQKCEMLTLKNSLSPFNGQWVGLVFSFSLSLNAIFKLFGVYWISWIDLLLLF